MSDRISEHISLKEGIKSHTATRLNIDNIPRDLDLINMKTIAQQVFEPLNNPDWLHVSYVSEDKNRRRCLLAYKKNGRTRYELI